MTTVNVTDRDGTRQEVRLSPGSTLMEILRDADLGVAALCGGMCSCATCHVYVDAAWLPKLPEMQSDEAEILNDLSTRQPGSRLSCQIVLRAEYDGLTVSIAPEE